MTYETRSVMRGNWLIAVPQVKTKSQTLFSSSKPKDCLRFAEPSSTVMSFCLLSNAAKVAFRSAKRNRMKQNSKGRTERGRPARFEERHSNRRRRLEASDHGDRISYDGAT